jgi:4-amino-4-deoxy-L-arabinose transferase-like glycosyltransferase
LTLPTLDTERTGLALLVLLSAALVAAAMLLPAFPVDETRYLTVAWEMRVTGNWSLPTLNFEPYSHKPPLLFWLINASWSVFGVAVSSARLVGVAATVAVLVLTHRLERELAPEPASGLAPSALMLGGLPLFLGLGFSIMFDMLLTATVCGAMLALWIAGRSGGWRAFTTYGACVGLGVLAKGPVVLLFTLPAALLASLWVDPAQRSGWYRRVGLALALAIFMGLSWALRAAYLGGPDYAEMLFWKQSAGRVASSFAHARPLWFYSPILLLFFAPLLVWCPLWTAVRRGFAHGLDASHRFLLCWIVPAFLGLSMISGKQLHYLLPVVPALALLVSLGLKQAEPRPSDRVAWLALAVALPVLLALFALRGRSIVGADSGVFAAAALQLDIPMLLLTGGLAVAALVLCGTTLRGMLIGLCATNLILLASVALQSRAILTQLFDLQPIADVVSPLRDRPIAVTQRTRGEFGFLARLEHPVALVPEANLPCWLAKNAGSLAIVRSRPGSAKPETSADLSVLHSRVYRLEETITVVQAAPSLVVARSEGRAHVSCD